MMFTNKSPNILLLLTYGTIPTARIYVLSELDLAICTSFHKH